MVHCLQCHPMLPCHRFTALPSRPFNEGAQELCEFGTTLPNIISFDLMAPACLPPPMPCLFPWRLQCQPSPSGLSATPCYPAIASVPQCSIPWHQNNGGAVKTFPSQLIHFEAGYFYGGLQCHGPGSTVSRLTAPRFHG